MWGYKLTASGNKNFKFSRSGWTEGSLWLLKTAIDQSKNDVAGVSANEALIDAIEGQFTKLKDIHFDKVAGSGMGFTLQLSGSFVFTYKFVQGRNPDTIRFELAKKIARCNNEMGDQVALALFDAIAAYQIHYISKGLDTSQDENLLMVCIAL